MKKLLIVLLVVAAFSCGDSRQSDREDTQDEEEKMEEGAGEDISPQLVRDDSLWDSRHDVDTISSAEGAQRQSERDSVD